MNADRVAAEVLFRWEGNRRGLASQRSIVTGSTSSAASGREMSSPPTLLVAVRHPLRFYPMIKSPGGYLSSMNSPDR